MTYVVPLSSIRGVPPATLPEIGSHSERYLEMGQLEPADGRSRAHSSEPAAQLTCDSPHVCAV